MPRIFLTAEWRNLIMVSFNAPAELLMAHLPAGLELDLIDGAPAVSLVAFEFRNTRVFGVPWPGFVNFPEWNLRFYVRTQERTPRRGVVFIREFVPSRWVSRMAKQLYNEPYTAAPMAFSVNQFPGMHTAICVVQFGGASHTLSAAGSAPLRVPPEIATEHLLKEHQWGFGRTRSGRTLCYEVTHPRWRIHDQARAEMKVDWAKLYGAQWSVMQNAKPFSTILAEGSAITVATATTLESDSRM
jgi:uncharacterized protein